MKYLRRINIMTVIALLIASQLFTSCKKDDDDNTNPTTPNFTGSFMLADQMGRPAINTVFVSSASKDQFNNTLPVNQGAAFQNMFETNLKALSPAYANPGDMNALGQDAATFTGLLATDVLNVTLDGKTTFFDGTNVLTGRSLDDDVISVELLLIFGGEDGLENPSLNDDHVDTNDKAFLSTFPYLATPW